MKKTLVTRASMPKYEDYIKAIKPLWDSHWITNMGQYHKELEEKLKEYLGVTGVSLMVNGHMALEMTLQAFGFPKGSEVITTPFTFVSTTHAISRSGLVPVFCDVKESDGTIDENQIEELITDKTVAILPVHVYGNVCNIEKIAEIAKEHGLKVIYDAAHAFAVQYKGKGIGSYGDASVFSFHATKVFNTIEGGAVTFSNYNLYERLYNLKNFGIRGEEVVEAIGANAKMNEFCAIMGLCNLNNIENNIRDRKERFEYYETKLFNCKDITLFNRNECDAYNYAYFPILLKSKVARDRVYENLMKHGIYSRKYFYPLTCDYQVYNEYSLPKNGFPIAHDLANRVLVLPFYEDIEYGIIDEIINMIKELVV